MITKIATGIVSAVNLFLGSYAILNALGILQDSKYADGTTWLVAILFFGLGSFGLYAAVKRRAKLPLLLNVAPWIIGVVAVFLALVLSNPH